MVALRPCPRILDAHDRMSVFGTKRTIQLRPRLSAFGETTEKVGFWLATVCPLMTHKRLSARSASEADYFIHTSPLHLAADTLLQAEADRRPASTSRSRPHLRWQSQERAIGSSK